MYVATRVSAALLFCYQVQVSLKYNSFNGGTSTGGPLLTCSLQTQIYVPLPPFILHPKLSFQYMITQLPRFKYM